MKKKYFKALSINLLFGIYIFSLMVWATPQRFSESKEIKKEFSVNADATLTLDNQYGNLNVQSWDQNLVNIEIKIEVEGNDKEQVLEQLEEIHIGFSNSADAVSVKTYLEKPGNSSWWKNWSFFKKNNQNFQINYFVKIPKTNEAVFRNQYGSIYLDELEGRATINCEYGKLNVDRLLADNNDIDLAYCSNSNIEYMKNGTVQIDYSGLTIGQTEILDLNADYSKVTIDEGEEIDFNCDYGKLNIGSVTDVDGNGDYVGIKIDEIRNQAEISLDYGALRITQIGANAQQIYVDSDYGAITIGVHPNWNFDFEVETEYTGFKTDLDLNYLKKIKENEDGYYQGSYGTSNEKGVLKLKSDYGGIKLTQN